MDASVGAGLLHLLVGSVIGPYAIGYLRGSFEETADLIRTVVVTCTVLLAWALLADPIVVPRSVPVVAGALALVGMCAIRFLVRSWRRRHMPVTARIAAAVRSRSVVG